MTPLTYATVRLEVDFPVEALWPHIAAFGGLENWADGVTACHLEGAGPGAIRTVTLPGRVVREQLVLIDPRNYRIRYQILPPHTMPAQNVYSDLALAALSDCRTAILWQSDATDFQVAPAELGARIERFYRASLAGLCGLVKEGVLF